MVCSSLNANICNYNYIVIKGCVSGKREHECETAYFGKLVWGCKRIETRFSAGLEAGFAEGVGDDGLRLFLDLAQVRFALEALGVDLVNRFRARRASGKPAILGDDF